MYARTKNRSGKTRSGENEGKAIANSVTQKKNTKQSTGFSDNRASRNILSNHNVGKGILQRVVGNKGLDDVKNAIYMGTSKAQNIATDIYNVNSSHDGDFTVDTKNKIKGSAETMGYESSYATRLANKNPYGKGDIKGNTKWENKTDRHVESFEFARIHDPRGDTVSFHQLNFENLYPDNGNSIFRFNARNPALASFFASDVVEEQRDWIKTDLGNSTPPDIKTITRENVSSVSGAAWRSKYPGWGAMNSTALNEFLTTTVNGQSSVSMLRGTGLIITEGEVVKYEPGDPTSTLWSVKLKVETQIVPDWLFS